MLFLVDNNFEYTGSIRL